MGLNDQPAEIKVQNRAEQNPGIKFGRVNASGSKPRRQTAPGRFHGLSARA